jgi:hypothetical protein
MQTIHQLTARFPTVDDAGKDKLVIETMEFNRDKDSQPWKAKAGTQTYWESGNPVQKQADGSFVVTKSKKVLKAK